MIDALASVRCTKSGHHRSRMVPFWRDALALPLHNADGSEKLQSYFVRRFIEMQFDSSEPPNLSRSLTMAQEKLPLPDLAKKFKNCHIKNEGNFNDPIHRETLGRLRLSLILSSVINGAR